jgi:hypothetical protein
LQWLPVLRLFANQLLHCRMNTPLSLFWATLESFTSHQDACTSKCKWKWPKYTVHLGCTCTSAHQHVFSTTKLIT